MLTTVPEEIQNFCKSQFGELRSFSPASGGCINNGGLLKTAEGEVFVKWNSAAKYPDMFSVEAKGLNLLRGNEVDVPEVLQVYEGKEYACLILEHINSQPKNRMFWQTLGHGLASIHQQTASQYGLDHTNYIGSLNQVNEHKPDAASFFWECRLLPQVQRAFAHDRLGARDVELFDELALKLPSLINAEAPALVHGDLWSGNFMVGNGGQPVLIDPAVAYSIREMDLAMTKLFGGFDQDFYEAYQEAYPKSSGFDSRCDIYNLYPLLVHVNLFGGSYYQQVMGILKRFI